MVIMAREMFKLRKGDQAICIKANGSVELGGIEGKPLIDEKGNIMPVILFAAAWARKTDAKVMGILFENFKQSVREGYFGFDAKKEFNDMESAASGAVTMESASGAVTMESASGAVTMESASGAVTMPKVDATPSKGKEEWDKHKEEEKILEAMGKRADPRVKKQRDAMKEGATVISVEPFTDHKLPDLPVEEVTKGSSVIQDGYSPLENVGNVTIEGGETNENQ
jgi:hypothetical protein